MNSTSLKKIWNTLGDIQSKVDNVKYCLKTLEREQRTYYVRKNACAVKLGQLGGRKGGLARALSLSPRRRKQIARKAALTRWGKIA